MKNFLCVAITVLLFFVDMTAGETAEYSYYYNAKSTGEGTVYASTKDVFNPPSWSPEINSTKQTIEFADRNTATAYQYIHLNANPKEGFGFIQWRKVESFGGNTTSTMKTRKTKVKEALPIDETRNFYYEADFGSTMVSVGTANGPYVQAFIDKEINQIGDKVILTASTQGNYKIVWKKKVGNTITDEFRKNPLLVEVTEKAHYIADIDDEGSKLTDDYYRIRTANPDPNVDNRYLRLGDSWFDMTEIVNGARNAIVNVPGIIERSQNTLKRDLNLSNNYITDPGTIVYLKNTSEDSNNNEYNFISQGIDVKNLTTGTYHGGSALTTISYNGCYVNIVQAGDVYSIFPKIAMKYSGASVDFGNFYFNNNNNTFTAEISDDSHNTKWIIERINTDNNFFSPDLTHAVFISENNKYYTTLRLPFDCRIPENSKLTAYSVTNYISSNDDGLVTKNKFIAGGTIPAGLPVIIESTSNAPEDNKLMPIGDPSNHISKLAASEGTTTGINTVLYNNYGIHAHDKYPDQPTSGDAVGYFSVAYTGSATLYKLSVNSDGVVGFWTPVANNETIYGNQAYATQPCALFPKEIELVDFPAAQDEITYKLVDPLTVAYVDNENNVIYAKDDNGATEQAPAEGEEDFMKLHYGDNTYVGHSNWVAIEATSAPELQPAASRIEATGKVAEAMPNRRLKATNVVEIDREGDFDPNTYCLVNFMPKSSHSTTHHNFFFAEPQANEIARIIWAQWDASTSTFIVPPTSGFTGVISTVFDLYNDSNNPTSKLQNGHQYQFIGLIKKTSAKDASNLYQLYPLSGITDHDDIITGVHNILTQSEVVSQKYYNTMGIESDVPFRGVNIMVTTYSDGSRKVTKVMR